MEEFPPPEPMEHKRRTPRNSGQTIAGISELRYAILPPTCSNRRCLHTGCGAPQCSPQRNSETFAGLHALQVGSLTVTLGRASGSKVSCPRPRVNAKTMRMFTLAALRAGNGSLPLLPFPHAAGVFFRQRATLYKPCRKKKGTLPQGSPARPKPKVNAKLMRLFTLAALKAAKSRLPLLPFLHATGVFFR